MKNIVLSFNFSKFTYEDSPAFPSFEDKLQMYFSAFENGYNLARQNFPDQKIILLSHEYAITSTDTLHSKVLSYAEHLKIQERLKEFTRLNQNCIVIFPYAFAKQYSEAHQASKLIKMGQRYQDDVYRKSAYFVERGDYEDYLNESLADSLKPEITVVRNVCYLFAGGVMLNKVDKRIPVYEYTLPNSTAVRVPFIKGSTFFQPGTNRNIMPISKTQSLAIEICGDHANGLLKSILGKSKLETYHLILADTVALESKHLIGQFNILCDAGTGTSLVQQKGAAKEECPIVIAVDLKYGPESIVEYSYEYVKPEILDEDDVASPEHPPLA